MMRSDTAFKTLNRIFQAVFFLTFIWLFINIICYYFAQKNYSPVFLFIPMAILCIAAYRLLQKFLPDCRNRQITIVFYVCMALMTATLLAIGYWLMFEPTTDLYTVNEMAKSVGTSGSMNDMYVNLPKGRWQYIARYPNNQFIFLLLTAYYRVLFLIFGKIPLYAPILLNVLSIAFTVFLVYQTAKKIFNPQAALLAFFMCFFFVPYYVYTPYFYTDSLSMPYVMISLFLFLNALKCKSKVKSYLLLLVTVLSIFIGYKLKGSVIIILAVCAVFLFLKCSWKKALACTCCGAALVLILSTCFSSLVLGLGVTNKEEMYEQEYPLTHWVMMGLKNPGGFNQDDSTFTAKAGNYDQKKAANINEIKKRISDYGIAGMYDHITQKSIYTWSDGNYFGSQHVVKTAIRPNYLHKFISNDGAYHDLYQGYCDSYQLMLLFLITCSALLSFFKPRLNFTVVLKGIILCAFIFFLVWETRSRYIFNFTPVFILTAVDAIVQISNFNFTQIKNKLKSNANKVRSV